jgi:sigma-E factor negative regulatory protein RseA
MAGSDSIQDASSEATRLQGEALSALFDGEASDLELRRLLATQEPELEEKWQRMGLAQALLQGQGSELRKLDPSFSQGVMAALSGEPSPTVGSKPWLAGFTKLAVAASVAAACVFVLQLALPPAPGMQETADQVLVSNAQPVERASDSRTVGPADGVQQLAAVAEPVDPIAQQRLQEYIAQMATRENQPMRTEHLQQSPLYRLVSETVELPLRR